MKWTSVLKYNKLDPLQQLQPWNGYLYNILILMGGLQGLSSRYHLKADCQAKVGESWSSRINHLGPVVQSILSLTSSYSLSVLWLYNQIHWNVLLKKMREAFYNFFLWIHYWPMFGNSFQQKYWHIGDINVWNFNETLTNDVVSFEQPDPDLLLADLGCNPQWWET